VTGGSGLPAIGSKPLKDIAPIHLERIRKAMAGALTVSAMARRTAWEKKASRV